VTGKSSVKIDCPKCGIKVSARGGWRHIKFCNGKAPEGAGPSAPSAPTPSASTSRAAQHAALKAAFDKTPATLTFTARVEAAFKATGLPKRCYGPDRKYYPSNFPYLTGKAASSRRTPKITAKHRRSAQSSQPDRDALGTAPNGLSSAPRDAGQALAEAVAGLRKSITDLVEATVADALTRSMNSAALGLVAPALQTRRGAPRAPIDRPARRGEIAPFGREFDLLTDDQIRDRLGMARAQKNDALVAKLCNVLRRRDAAANTITTRSRTDD